MTNPSIEPIHPTKHEAVLEEVKRVLRIPPVPVPVEALDLLWEAACADTGTSQAVRYYLFWLAGLPDPTGHQGAGGLELRRADHRVRLAALEVFRWWLGPARNDQPLLQLLSKLQACFAPRPERG